MKIEVKCIEKLACYACLKGWSSGALVKPIEGGEKCVHGRGQWQVGSYGPRGGWYALSPRYTSEAAAVLVRDALVQAAQMPAQGVA